MKMIIKVPNNQKFKKSRVLQKTMVFQYETNYTIKCIPNQGLI